MHHMSDQVRSDERTLLGAAINPPVFFGSLIVLLIVIAATIIIGEPAEELFAKGQRIISHATGWFFILLVNLLLFFLVFLAFSKFGNIRIGGKKATPDFSRASWFAMLFSAGMGIGLVFWEWQSPFRILTTIPSWTMEIALPQRRAPWVSLFCTTAFMLGQFIPLLRWHWPFLPSI